jgi:hypothetical protein
MYKKSERHFSAGPVDLQPYEMRAWRCWGLCRHRHLLHLKVHVRIPALKNGATTASYWYGRGVRRKDVGGATVLMPWPPAIQITHARDAGP